MDLAKVIKRPVITEKSLQETAFGRYTFAVDRRATKSEIASAVEKFFAKHLGARYQEGGTPEVIARLKEITVDTATVAISKKAYVP